jgi:hypothetical protein
MGQSNFRKRKNPKKINKIFFIKYCIFNNFSLNLQEKIMAKLMTGSIDVALIDKKLIKEVEKKDGTKAKYINVNVWLNDEPDKFGNNASIQQYTGKDSDKKIYLGNLKEFKGKDSNSEEGSGDLPF